MRAASQFILFVADQQRSATFYSRVLARDPRLHTPGMTEYDLPGGGVLGLMPEGGIRNLLGAALPDPALAQGVPRAELYLVLPEPHLVYKRALEAGAIELSPMLPRNWGHVAGYVQDPDGHVLAFSAAAQLPIEGGCNCKHVRYRVHGAPLFVHCCHCRWCQRESGASFALNAMIESDRVELLTGTITLVDTPSASGRGQKIARCPHCSIALWSHYAGAGPLVTFIRVGSLDNPDVWPPDIHIFTASKQPWVVLPEGTPAVPEYYDREAYWSPESLARRTALLPLIETYQATLKW